jgi:hypothetical protein
LRQTCPAARRGWLRGPAAETPNGAQLGIERGFKYGKDRIFEVFWHGQLLRMNSGGG